ncbi:hypothetical protein GJAV_G00225110 [Gymnothorax javanicus]|nr:hypothetical protein GJAV_G00225110 [Gymnothorax javanicus]
MKRNYPSGAEKREDNQMFLSKLPKVTSFFTTATSTDEAKQQSVAGTIAAASGSSSNLPTAVSVSAAATSSGQTAEATCSRYEEQQVNICNDKMCIVVIIEDNPRKQRTANQ